MSQKCKISIVLPVHNGIKYIEEFLKSVLSIKDNNNFELVISENCSVDGTKEYLRDISKKYDFIKLFETETLLSQSDNWSNGILKSRGDWVILLGVDDALTPQFFTTAEKLIKIAEEKNLNIIKTNRIYYFWNDDVTKKIYNNRHYSYFSRNFISVKKTKDALYGCLYMGQFVDMPQMYTTSLFSRNLIKKIESIAKNEKIIQYGSPDSYLGAAACFFEDKYLYAETPIAWVGTSSSSQGYKDSHESNSNLTTLSMEEYKSLAATTYKTINSTELLVCGALNSIQEKTGIKKYNIDKIQLVKNVAYKKLYEKNESSSCIDDLLQAWNISKKDLVFKPYFKINSLNFVIKKLFSKILYKSFCFEADYSDKKTYDWKYSDVNNYLANLYIER